MARIVWQYSREWQRLMGVFPPCLDADCELEDQEPDDVPVEGRSHVGLSGDGLPLSSRWNH